MEQEAGFLPERVSMVRHAGLQPTLGRRSGAFRAPIAVILLIATGVVPSVAVAQIPAYNPYADSQDQTPPVLPDGTIHWGTFYKSAAIQKAYERLWNLGACRNTNKAITIPVENNRLAIDSLAEGEFRGVVQAVTGANAGGAVAFVQSSADNDAGAERVAILHPAGVTKVEVSGTAPVSFLTPGMAVRFQATVDPKGRATSPVGVFHVIAPASEAKPAAVNAGVEEMIVGRVVQMKRGVLAVRVDAGKIRRITLPLAPGAFVQVDGGDVGLATPGDLVEIKGRLWTGDGALGDGTVFADRISVTKKATAAGEPRADDSELGAR
jgi:hypothetical protein